MKSKTDIGQIEVAQYDWPRVLRLVTTDSSNTVLYVDEFQFNY